MTSSTPALIRHAREDELALLAPLELRAAARFHDSPHPYACALPPFDPEVLLQRQRDGMVWVAAGAADEPLGFAVGGWLGTEPYLAELDVEPSHGSRGIGRALVRRVGEWARDAGGASLLLSTFGDVPYNGPFYAKLGFTVVPLDDYGPTLRALRQSEAIAGMRIESRVIMRAALERLLSLP